MGRGLSRLLLSGATALAMWSPAARAEEPPWLRWQAPPECPTGEHIAKTLEGWLGRPFGAEEGQVTAAISATSAGWDVNVLVVQRDLRGERSMRTRTCIEAADFVALSVALAVDPGLAGSLPAPTTSDQQDGKNTSDGPSAEPASEASSSKEVDGKRTSAPSPPANTASAKLSASPEQIPLDPTSADAHWSVQAGASFDAFTFPSVRLGATAHLGVSVGRLSVSAGARWLPPVTESVPSAVSDVAFSLLTGQLRVGYLSQLGNVELSPYVEGQLGQLFAEAADYSVRQLWLAVGGGGQLTWPATSRVQAYVALGALFPLQRSTFTLSGGTEVHQLPALTFEGDSGLRINF